MRIGEGAVMPGLRPPYRPSEMFPTCVGFESTSNAPVEKIRGVGVSRMLKSMAESSGKT